MKNKYRPKLGMQQAREIRRLYTKGKIGYTVLAKFFGVHRRAIQCIIKGITYKE
jgi:hypothetical protein